MDKEDPTVAMLSWSPEEEAARCAQDAIDERNKLIDVGFPAPVWADLLREAYLAGFRDGQIELEAGRWFESVCGPRNRG